jgi:LysM repeat protein
MKIKIITGVLSFVFFANNIASAQSLNNAYLQYIELFHKIAQKQQKEHRIPASIILAQGLLESGAGQSEFTKMSNNHFGIKCNDWAGDKIYHDDDEKGECFRKYNQVLDSYEDHSKFLITRPRYSFLFNLQPTDYEGWAFGLKKAGYATDPTYGFKLVSIIETYNLHRFDNGKYNEDKNSTDEIKQNLQNTNYYGSSIGTIHATPNHMVFKVNGVKCLKALQNDTYAGLADEFNISEARLREMNEVSSEAVLQPGFCVYISNKRCKAYRSFETHLVQPGETMHTISQDYGVKIECLYKLNKMAYTEGAKIGQMLKMR